MGFRYGSDSGDGAVSFAGPSGQIDLEDANNEGASESAARADHQHAFPAPTGAPPAVLDTSAVGSSKRAARQDHRHAHTAGAHRAGGHADLTGDFADIAAPAAAVGAHEGASNPHDQYKLASEALAAADVVLQALADAKGDLIAATGADTWARVPVGADGEFLMADSSEPGGVGFGAGPEGGVTDHGALTGLADNDHPHYRTEAKETAGSANTESVTWTTAFSAVPVVNVSYVHASSALSIWITSRSTTAAEARTNTGGQVKMFIAREAT